TRVDYLIHHMLKASAQRTPDKEALVHGKERLSYSEVSSRTAGLAEGLRNAGLLRSDRIGIYLEASIQQVISIFGISEAGGVYVPINGTLFPDQVAHVAKDCSMKGLITTRRKLAALAEVLAQIASLEFVVLTEDGENPDIKPKVHSFEEFCSGKPSAIARE